MERALRAQAALPIEFWGYAILHTARIKNLSEYQISLSYVCTGVLIINCT
jgi:hypothetical protein